jgi:hypothetical protein
VKNIQFNFPNGILFISDVDGGLAPYPKWGALVQSTPSCISVACTPDSEGPTDVIIGAAENVNPGGTPVFDGKLDTPNRTLVVSTVDRQTVVSVQVRRAMIHVRVWVNEPTVPDRVIIGVE